MTLRYCPGCGSGSLSFRYAIGNGEVVVKECDGCNKRFRHDDVAGVIHLP